MLPPFVRACWMTASPGSDTGAEVVRAYLELLGASEDARSSAAYALVERTSLMTSIRDRLADLDRGEDAQLPDTLVLTEVASVDAGLDLEAHVEAGIAGLRAELGADAQIVVEGLYREITFTDGVEEPPASGFGPVVQFGTFDMASAEDEWAVSDWYRTRRLASFSKIPGGIRARRLVSVCGGPAKLGVLYEFTSPEARVKHFEPLEAVDHDEDRPTAAARTIHPAMSPSVGEIIGL